MCTRKPLIPWFSFLTIFSICLSCTLILPALLPHRSLWCNTRPCAATTGSLELTNPCEGSPGSYKPSLGLPTWGSVLWMFPWGPRDMGEAGWRDKHKFNTTGRI